MPDWKPYIRQNLRLRGVRPARESEIVEDLAQQLEEAYREALAGGMGEAEASASARRHIPDWDALNRELQACPQNAASLDRALDSVEALSQYPRWRFLGNLPGDIRFALRMMRKSPGFTAIVVLTLSLGIGSTTAIFGVVNAVLLHPLPYPDAGRLVIMREIARRPGKAPDLMSVSWPTYQDWRAQLHTVDHLGVFRVQNANWTRVDPPERLRLGMVSANVFSALESRPLLGRRFIPAEDVPAAAPTIILSETLWRNRFGAATDVLGRSLTLDGVNYEVIGVMPGSFQFPDSLDAWVPLGPFVNGMPADRGNHPGLVGLARLRPGIDLYAAQIELDTVNSRLTSQYPDTNRFVGGQVLTLADTVIGGIRTNLLVLLAAVGLVLLIACVNIANLVMARGESRLREVSVRRALGASRARLMAQLLTESLVLSAIGALLGASGAWLALRILVKASPTFVPRLDAIGMDSTVLAFTAGLAVAVAALFGLWPAMRVTSANAQIALRDSMRTSSGHAPLRPFLVAGEAALATMLLIGAALMIRTFVHLTRIELGFRPDHVLTVRVGLPVKRYATTEQVSVFYRSLLDRVSGLPGAGAAGITSIVPLAGGIAESSILPEGMPIDPKNPGPGCTFSAVSAGYFQAIGTDVLAGRTFNEHDTANAPPVIVVDESAATSLWPGQNPVGKRVSFEFRGQSIADLQPVWREVVGVVRRVRYYDLTGTSSRVQIYVPYTQPPLYSALLPAMVLMVRTEGDPAQLTAAIRHEVAAIDPDLPVFLVRTMSGVVDRTLEQPRLSTTVLTGFSALALLLAVIGIYGVLSWSVAQRTREIGIRLALGATRVSVLRLVLSQGALIAAAGVMAGLAGSLASMRLIGSLLFGVSPTDPATYIAIPVTLFAAALCATIVPARRATRIDPAVALRDE
jgi:putative ABC transport system permease protein